MGKGGVVVGGTRSCRRGLASGGLSKVTKLRHVFIIVLLVLVLLPLVTTATGKGINTGGGTHTEQGDYTKKITNQCTPTDTITTTSNNSNGRGGG